MSKVQSILEDLKAQRGETVSAGKIVACISEEGFPVTLLTMALVVMALPVPSVPPFNFFYSLPFIYLGWPMMRGREKPSIPSWLAERRVKSRNVKSAADRIQKLTSYIEEKAKPSWQGIAHYRHIGRLVGTAVLFLTFSIALPVPGTAFVPAFLIALMALGLIHKDGKLIVAALAGATIWMVLLLTILGEAADEIVDAAEFVFKIFG